MMPILALRFLRGCVVEYNDFQFEFYYPTRYLLWDSEERSLSFLSRVFLKYESSAFRCYNDSKGSQLNCRLSSDYEYANLCYIGAIYPFIAKLA